MGHLEAQQHWDLDQSVVKQLKAASVPDSVFNAIKTGATAKDIWDELKKLYERRTILILVDLRREIQTMCCAEEDSVRDHFNYLSDLHKQLAAMGKSMPDSKFTSILMGSLPPSYQPTLTGIATITELSAMTPTVAVVTKLAIDEFDRRTLLKDSKAKDEAFAASSLKKGKM